MTCERAVGSSIGLHTSAAIAPEDIPDAKRLATGAGPLLESCMASRMGWKQPMRKNALDASRTTASARPACSPARPSLRPMCISELAMPLRACMLSAPPACCRTCVWVSVCWLLCV